MISERILISFPSRFVKHKTKIKLNPSNLFIRRVRCSKKNETKKTSRVRSRESQKKSIRDKLKKEPGRPVVNPKNVKVLGVKGKIGKKED